MSEIAIIGAGITGAYTAFLLANGGHQVVILDDGSSPYRGTSCNPGGINPLHGPGMPGSMADFYMSCHNLHHLYKDQVQELSGIDYRFRVIDRLFLAFTQEETEVLLKMQDDYNAHEGFQAKWYTQEQLDSLDSRISAEALGGLLTHGNVVVDSERYCEALKLAAIKLGARHVDSNVDEVITHENRITHIVAGGEQIPCSAAILAAGYWTDRLSRELGSHVAVTPVKGELLLVRLDDKPFDFDITRGQTGLYQCEDDLYWFGGTTDDPLLWPGTTAEAKARILENIKLMLPGLKRYSLVAHSAGYRPVSADKLPVIGHLPGYENIYVGTGGGSKGILVSAGIASGLKGLVERSPTDDYAFLAPDRFNVTD
jgi:glycine oxidase